MHIHLKRRHRIFALIATKTLQGFLQVFFLKKRKQSLSDFISRTHYWRAVCILLLPEQNELVYI